MAQICNLPGNNLQVLTDDAWLGSPRLGHFRPISQDPQPDHPPRHFVHWSIRKYILYYTHFTVKESYKYFHSKYLILQSSLLQFGFGYLRYLRFLALTELMTDPRDDPMVNSSWAGGLRAAAAAAYVA